MRLLFAVCSLFVLVGIAPAAAQTIIHRCVGANGGPVFTDQPCVALDATPLVQPIAPATPGTPPAPVILCAADGHQLKRVVIEAFAAHDANRLAGVMLWGGYGAHAAVADILALQRLMREPLLGVTTEPPAGGDPVVAGAASTADPEQGSLPTALLVQTGGADNGEGPHALLFDVVPMAGCLWLRSAAAAEQQAAEY